ncbi:hypothetical protein L9F63_002370, partial [Diploptera punctata]
FLVIHPIQQSHVLYASHMTLRADKVAVCSSVLIAYALAYPVYEEHKQLEHH